MDLPYNIQQYLQGHPKVGEFLVKGLLISTALFTLGSVVGCNKPVELIEPPQKQEETIEKKINNPTQLGNYTIPNSVDAGKDFFLSAEISDLDGVIGASIIYYDKNNNEIKTVNLSKNNSLYEAKVKGGLEENANNWKLYVTEGYNLSPQEILSGIITAQKPVVEEPKPEISKYHQFLIDNPEASEGFTADEYELAKEHLKRTPEVMNEPELYEAFNAKIKIEEDLLKDLGLFSPGELDWKEILLANWSDVYNRLYKGENNEAHRTVTIDGKEYSVLSKTALAQRIPDEKDREMYYKGLWVPKGLKQFYPSEDWSKWPNPDRVSYDMDYSGNKSFVVENLNNLETLASNIMEAYNNPDLFLHQRARERWESIPDKSFPIAQTTLEKYVDLYKRNGDLEIDLARFVHGLTISLYEEDHIGIDQILCKSLGIVVFEQRAPYLHGELHDGKIFTHGEPAIVVPKSILDEIIANPDKYGAPMVFRGQTIGWISNYEVTGKLEEDVPFNLPFVEFHMPDGVTILTLDENYKHLSKKIELYRKAGIVPETLTKEDLQSERKNLK